jgi:hypothetical protein
MYTERSNTLWNNFKSILNVMSGIVLFMIASAIVHWGLSYSYYHFCVGNTVWDILLSPLNTGSMTCQIIFKGMRMTQYEYLTQLSKLFTVL